MPWFPGFLTLSYQHMAMSRLSSMFCSTEAQGKAGQRPGPDPTPTPWMNRVACWEERPLFPLRGGFCFGLLIPLIYLIPPAL